VRGNSAIHTHARRARHTAVPRPQLSTIDNSAGKASLTPGSSPSGFHDPRRAPGLPGGGSSSSGRSPARARISSASRAASRARLAWIRCSSSAFSSGLSQETGRRGSGVGRVRTQSTSIPSTTEEPAITCTTPTLGRAYDSSAGQTAVPHSGSRQLRCREPAGSDRAGRGAI
jgi:hypothetical protein